MPIPRSAEEWAAFVPNETDREIRQEWCDKGLISGCDSDDEVMLAAASRLLEQERCVERLAKWMEDGMPMTDDDPAITEARRILGVEP